jgi:hypothetical protein
MEMVREELLAWERAWQELGLDDPAKQQEVEAKAQAGYEAFIKRNYPHLAGRIEPMSKEPVEAYWERLHEEYLSRMDRIAEWTAESFGEHPTRRRRERGEKRGGGHRKVGSSGRRPEGEADDRRAQGGEAEEEAADEAWWKSMF